MIKQKSFAMNQIIISFIRDQVNRINEAGLSLLLRNFLLFLITPFLLLIVLFVRLLRPLILIRFGELIGRRIGHFASNTEIYLCERDLGIQNQRSIDVFYINGSVCNRQLMKMWSRILCVSTFATGLDLINRALPGGEKHIVLWRKNQDRDIHGALESTKAHLAFTAKEERIGQELLSKLGITGEAGFICFLSRDSSYLDAVFPKGKWHYHDYRDSNIKDFIPAAEELTRRGYFAVRMGAVVKEMIETDNPMIIDYATKHRTDFLDIFLAAKCHFCLIDSSGFYCVPMIFRQPVVIVNMIPLEYVPAWSSSYLFIPKKQWLRKENRLRTFREMLSSETGDSKRYEQSGIEIINNTAEEITAAAIEMELRLKGKWQGDKEDEEMQQRFWSLFKPGEINRVFRSRIGAEFLRQNKELLK